MPFKDEIFFATAKNHEIAGLAIKASRINNAVIMALMKIDAGKKPTEEIKMLKDLGSELDKIFERLSGYYDE